MKRTIILTLGISIVGFAAYLAGASNQSGSTFLVDALSQTKAPATSSLVPSEPGEACIYGGELFSENAIICFGAASRQLVCRGNQWALVKEKVWCDTNSLSPLS